MKIEPEPAAVVYRAEGAVTSGWPRFAPQLAPERWYLVVRYAADFTYGEGQWTTDFLTVTGREEKNGKPSPWGARGQ